MTNHQTGGRGQSALPSHHPIASVFAGVILLLLAGAGAWLLPLDEASVLAAVVGILVLALLAFAIRGVSVMRRASDAPAPQQADACAIGPVVGRNETQGANLPAQDTVAPLNGKRWNLDVFAHIDAQRFAAVCETWFSWAGFDTRSESHRTSEGVDIWLHAAKVPGPVAIVRCRHWLDKPVGLQEMREFMGLVESVKSAHGTYTTTSTYTPEALQFAKEHGIDAVDGRGLLRKIQTRTRQSQQALLAVAYSHQT